MTPVEHIRALERDYPAKFKLVGATGRIARRPDADASRLRERLFNDKTTLRWEKILDINRRIVARDNIEAELRDLVRDDKALRRLAATHQTISNSARAENLFIEKHAKVDAGDLVVDFAAFHKALSEDVAAFKRFVREFEALRSKRIEAKIIGIGEITTTIELVGDDRRVVRHSPTKKAITRAVKKMPLFPDEAAANRYITLMRESHRVLNSIGVDTPRWGAWKVVKPEGAVVYNWQERLPQESVGALVIHKISDDEVRRLFRLVMDKAVGAFDYNRSGGEYTIGFDAQIPNWSVVGFDAKNPRIVGDEKLLYFDTSTPLMRKKTGEAGGKPTYGKDLLDTELFLKSVPAPTRPLIRAFMIDEVLDRYYMPRQVITDVIASFYLYRRADMVPALVEETNNLIKTRLASYDLKPFSVEEMAKYHKTDTMIWVLFRALKRADRWITENILGKRYGQRLPKNKFTPGPFGEA